MNYLREIKLWGPQYGGEVNNAVKEIMDLFVKQGHSGNSAALTAEAAYKLMTYQPLTPLTGEDDEWNDVGGGLFQNNRYSALFKEPDGTCRDVNAVTFEEVGKPGKYFTNGWLIERWHKARPAIKFPYTPPMTKVVARVKEVNGRWVIVNYGAGKR